MKRLLVGLVALLLAAGCGSPSLHPPVPQGPLPELGPGFDLFVAENQGGRGLAVVDAASGQVERRLPAGVLNADGSRLLAPTGESLLVLDPRTGARLGEERLPRAYELPPATLGGLPGGLSPNGRWLVLQAFEPERQQAQPTTRSRFALVDTTLKEKARFFEVTGFFTFDGIDNAARTLYLNHFTTGRAYRVEVYDLLRMQLTGYSVTDKTEPNEQMAGIRLSGVFSADGAWQYSVYLNQESGPFVHALNLNGQFAWCIDLPRQDKAGESQFQWSLAISPDGSRLYAANAALGLVSEIPLGGNGKPRVARTAQVGMAPQARSFFWTDAEAKRLVSSTAALSPDGRTLYFGDRDLVAVDTSSLQVRGRLLSGWRLQSLAASPDGVWLFVLGEDGPLARVEMAGGRLAQQAGTALSPVGFLRITARG